MWLNESLNWENSQWSQSSIKYFFLATIQSFNEQKNQYNVHAEIWTWSVMFLIYANLWFMHNQVLTKSQSHKLEMIMTTSKLFSLDPFVGLYQCINDTGWLVSCIIVVFIMLLFLCWRRTILCWSVIYYSLIVMSFVQDLLNQPLQIHVSS